MRNYAVKLIDFGSAFEFPENSPIAFVGYRNGTPAYLAPECWKGLYSPATDMWAVGVLLCYLLFLKPPYFDPPSDDECKAAISGMNFTTDKGESVHLKRLYSIVNIIVRYENRFVSKECKEFLSGLLRKKYQDRLTARGALAHPWIKKYSNSGLVS